MALLQQAKKKIQMAVFIISSGFTLNYCPSFQFTENSTTLHFISKDNLDTMVAKFFFQ